MRFCAILTVGVCATLASFTPATAREPKEPTAPVSALVVFEGIIPRSQVAKVTAVHIADPKKLAELDALGFGKPALQVLLFQLLQRRLFGVEVDCGPGDGDGPAQRAHHMGLGLAGQRVFGVDRLDPIHQVHARRRAGRGARGKARRRGAELAAPGNARRAALGRRLRDAGLGDPRREPPVHRVLGGSAAAHGERLSR